MHPTARLTVQRSFFWGDLLQSLTFLTSQDMCVPVLHGGRYHVNIRFQPILHLSETCHKFAGGGFCSVDR